MEILLLLLLAGFVLTTPIWALIWLLKLSKRISNLESLHGKDFVQLEKVDLNVSTVSSEEDIFAEDEPELIEEQEVSVQAKTVSKPAEKETEPFSWEDFFTRKFFSILGITSLVLAIGFFAVWSFANGWIGPKGRIAIGAVLSLGLLVAGELMRGKYPKFFPVFSSAGIVGLLTVTYIAQHLYSFVSPVQSFILYILEVSAGLTLALRYNSRLLGNFSVIGGLLAPLLVGAFVFLNPLGLLGYILVLSAGGFVVALRQKWIEIFAILLFGALYFESLISATRYGYSDPGQMEHWFQNNPIVYLVLVFVIHTLIGSGGVVRMVREKEKQELKNINTLSGIQTIEMVLFIIAILSMNFFAYRVFEVQDWNHFGFFVLGQGVLFYGLSEYFGKKNLLIMRNLASGGTMIALVLATIWEIGVENDFVLSIALILEGILLMVAGQSIGQKWFTFFGRIAVFIGSLFIWEISDVWQSLVAVLLFISSVYIGLKQYEKDWEKVLGILALIWGIILFLSWNFVRLDRLLSSDTDIILFVIAVLGAVTLAYSSFVKVSSITKPIALGMMGIVTFIFLGYVAQGWARADWAIHLLSLIVVLAGSFGVLASFFFHSEDTKKVDVSDSVKLVLVYITLSVTTLTVLIWGGEILWDPSRTFLWLVWGGTLFLVGNHNQWKSFRMFGIGMMLLIIGKLYLVDVWGWNTGEKVVAFLVLAVSLLGISFIAQKKLK